MNAVSSVAATCQGAVGWPDTILGAVIAVAAAWVLVTLFNKIL